MSDEAVMDCHDAENGKNRSSASQSSHDLLINGQQGLTNERLYSETVTNQTPGHVIH